MFLKKSCHSVMHLISPPAYCKRDQLVRSLCRAPGKHTHLRCASLLRMLSLSLPDSGPSALLSSHQQPATMFEIIIMPSQAFLRKPRGEASRHVRALQAHRSSGSCGHDINKR